MIFVEGEILVVDSRRHGPTLIDRRHTCRVVREATGNVQVTQTDGGTVSVPVQGDEWAIVKAWFRGGSDGD